MPRRERFVSKRHFPVSRTAFTATCAVAMEQDMRKKLIEAATAVAGEFELRKDFSAGAVGAAILSGSGRIYTGICVDIGCGLGFCAEMAAAAEMLKNRETHVVAAVAVFDGDSRGVCGPPCGRCRETLAQLNPLNMDCICILGPARDVPLRELLPDHWLTRKRTH